MVIWKANIEHAEDKEEQSSHEGRYLGYFCAKEVSMVINTHSINNCLKVSSSSIP